MTIYIDTITKETMVFGAEVTHSLNTTTNKYELFANGMKLNVSDNLAPQPPTAAELAVILTTARTAASLKIDADNDKIYLDVMGQKSEEYQLVRNQAQSFKEAGYSGAVPAAIRNWGILNAQSDKWAADYLLSQALSWDQNKISIRTQRINYKTQIKNANDLTSIQTWLDGWNRYVVNIRSVLGI